MTTGRQRWLLTGGSGLLGTALGHHLVAAGHHVVGVRHGHPIDVESVEEVVLDLADVDALRALVEDVRPTHVVHAAAVTNVDRCEEAESEAYHLHVVVTEVLARAALTSGARFVFVSTDHLWRGDRALVTEEVEPEPLNVYARTKAAGEQAALDVDASALVVRTNFFGRGPTWRQSFSDWIVGVLRRGEELAAFRDVWFTPIALPLLCPILVAAVDAGMTGRLHLAGADRLNKLDFACRLASALGLPEDHIVPSSIEDAPLLALRPRDMSLDCRRAEAALGLTMPGVDSSINSVYGTASPQGPSHSVGAAVDADEATRATEAP